VSNFGSILNPSIFCRSRTVIPFTLHLEIIEIPWPECPSTMAYLPSRRRQSCVYHDLAANPVARIP
jgi:hypothetical protein